MLPTFFVIGAAKAGTTSLSHYLESHPEIHMSPIKEPHFFAGPENGFPYPRHRIKALADYERLFETHLDARGEASPSYTQFARRIGVPERINETVPDAKFIYIVRDPIDRTISHFMHWAAFEAERRTLRSVLSDAESLVNVYTCGGRYGTQLEQYLRYFPDSRILVIDHQELLSNRRRTLANVYAFIGVDPTFWSRELERQLSTRDELRVVDPRYARVRDAAAELASVLPRRLRRSLGHLLAAVEGRFLASVDAPTLDRDLRERLVEIYQPEVDRLRALTGQAFATWSL